MLQGWLVFCSICIGPWHQAQSKLSPLCSQWLIQSTLQLFSYDAALGTHCGPRLADEGRREEALHSCMGMHACFASPGPHAQQQAALEGTAAFWDLLIHMVIDGFVVSSQKCWLSGSCTSTSTSSSPRTSAQMWQAGAKLVALSMVPLLFGGRALLPCILHCLTPNGLPRAEHVIEDRDFHQHQDPHT